MINKKLELDMIWRNIQTITSCNLNYVFINKLIKKKSNLDAIINISEDDIQEIYI